ncbi:hypothetical protein FGG08_003928 [Glutinoglossum americanum]|uniref:NWD NACHT-NTPase N-terminal domain-containing protein n=1 Tax=Glutinoglossum americanum TaxID=1670608 RepID=A0A9P8L030_9PEZI|nr:hypothetical protein FGG08_003928 [Glutinoglossum americanum]
METLRLVKEKLKRLKAGPEVANTSKELSSSPSNLANHAEPGFGSLSEVPQGNVKRCNSFWDRAYEELCKEKKELVEEYKKTLMSEPGVGSINDLDSPLEREEHMSRLVNRKLSEMEGRQWKVDLGNKSVRVRNRLDRIAKFVAVAFVPAAASVGPVHIGLPWAGLFMNDNMQRTTAIDGLEKISRLIPRYTEIERIYFQGGEFTLQGDLEGAIIELYIHILEFEARAACQSSRNIASQTARNAVKADNWEGILGKIGELEAVCEKLTLTIDAEENRAHMRLVENVLDNQNLRLNEQLKKQDDWYRSADESSCHKSLRTTLYEENKDRNPDRVPGTCEWFLRHRKYQEWLNQPTSTFLLVTADPGCGKSVLSKFLINDYQNIMSTHICYFFFKDDSEENKSATHALCALLHQLFSQNNALLKYATPEFKRNGDKLPQLFDTLWSILMEIAASPSAGSIICVLDALDECAESTRIPLIKKLASFYSSSKAAVALKFIVTSRPNTAIRDAFVRENLDLTSVQLMGENETEMGAISAEIGLVVKDRVGKFGRLRRESGIEDGAHITLQKRLDKIENRTYLWVALIFPELEKSVRVSEKKLLKVTETIPTTVFDAYEKILAAGSDIDRAKKLLLLHIVVAAARPLTLAEMNMALSIKDGDKSVDEVDLDPKESFSVIVRELCGLFVSIRDSKIYLIHQTAKEFLVSGGATVQTAGRADSCWKWQHSLEPRESNLLVAKICIWYLLFSVFESHPLPVGVKPYEIKELVNKYSNEHVFLDYAANHWARHFREAEIREDRAMLKSTLDICDARSGRFSTWFQVYWSAARYGRYPQNFTDMMLGSYFGLEEVVRLLLGKGVDMDSKDIYGRTPLSYAAGGGRKAVVKLLLEKGGDVDSRDVYGRTPLSYTAERGHEAVVKLLLEKRADVNLKDGYCQTPLLFAAKRGNVMVVELLLEKGGDVDSKDIYGRTPLSYAAGGGHEAVMKLLLEKGGDMNSKDDIGRTPLLFAAEKGDVMAVELLLEKGGDMNSKDGSGRTPLLFAAKRGNVMAVELLLEKGGSVDSKDTYGRTPLSYAAGGGHGAVVKLLLEKGGDVGSKDDGGRTPLLFAARGGNVMAVELLLEKGGDVDSKDIHGQTPLSYAAAGRGHEAVMKLLLEKGGDMNSKDDGGRTPLFFAAKRGNVMAVELLLEKGGGVDSKDTYGRTPLSYAAGGGREAVMKLLLEKGGDISSKDDSGRTPLSFAMEGGHEAAIALLMS